MESSALVAFNVSERPKQNSRGKAFTRASIWRSAYEQRRVYELDCAKLTGEPDVHFHPLPNHGKVVNALVDANDTDLKSSLILPKTGNRSPFPTGEDGKVRPIGREGVGTLLVSLEKGSEVEREAGALAALSKESKGENWQCSSFSGGVFVEKKAPPNEWQILMESRLDVGEIHRSG
ncbi:hypothetical protein L1987_16578 [Smallanthus sonchifolius]|uniref:Uncharacterized protein n=1 Tax=Smallanthus sonchifolius TaxID=185202 RepID=A0ACB9IUT9_9ASTR|nr:hypothetical protein L1987_16578 [Smallanthus sonchifolius]